MSVMAKQANTRVSSVKLPDGRYTQTGREALLEVCRVYFLDSRLTDENRRTARAIGPGQEHKQDHQGILEPGQKDNRSKIKWAISTFVP
jgi:hypothetical protein